MKEIPKYTVSTFFLMISFKFKYMDNEKKYFPEGINPGFKNAGVPDWEQRRYEVAKEMVCHIYDFTMTLINRKGLPEELEDLERDEIGMKIIETITNDAVQIADALISKLKPKVNNDFTLRQQK